MRTFLDTFLIAGLRIVLLIGVFALSLFPLSSVDVWLHLGIGQEIALRGEIPTTGWGSRLLHDREWVAHEWAFQAVFYRIHAAWGDRGLVLLRAIAATLAMAALLWALSEAGAGPYAACAAVSAAAAVSFSQLFWPARPQIVTQLFLPLLLALLVRGQAGKRRLLLLVPLLFVVWVNVHGAYAIGLVAILLFLIGDLLGSVFRGTGDPIWRKTLVRLLAASIIACLANPYTYRALIYPFTYYFGEPITAGNVEWAPLALKEFPLYEGIALLTALSILVARPGPNLLEVVLAVAFFHLSLVSVRHVPLGAAVLALVLGASWSRLWKAEPLSFPPPIASVAAAARASPWLRGGLTFLAMILCFTSIWFSDTPPWWHGGSRLSRGAELPTEEVDALEKAGLKEGLFNQYEWGGYLIYRFPGEDIVTIDGRNDLYGAEFNKRYMEAIEGIPTWKQTFDAWGVKTALISKGPQGGGLRFALHADPDWEFRIEGPYALVFARRER